MSGSPGIALIVASDLLARTRLEEAARAAGVPTASLASLPDLPEEAPLLLVVDLDAAGVLDGLARWRERWSGLRIVGVVSHTDEARRGEAEAIGCEVVTRGAAARRGAEIFSGRGTGPRP